MSDQELSIFEDETAMAEAPEPEQQEIAAEPEQEAAPEPQAEASEPGDQEAAPPVAAPEPEPTQVPIQAILDEREKRQESQRLAQEAQEQARRYQEKIRQMEEAQQQPPPDWHMDPEAAAKHQMQAFQHQIQANTLRQSRFFAEREYGAELVGEAFDFFNQNPQLSHQFMSEPSPFHAAVEFYQKQKFLSEVGSDPEAYRAKVYEEAMAKAREEIAAENAAQPKTTPKPPRSLSTAPAGGKLDAIAVDAPPQLNALFNG